MHGAHAWERSPEHGLAAGIVISGIGFAGLRPTARIGYASARTTNAWAASGNAKAIAAHPISPQNG
jgi:hypothetical protein